MFYDKYLSSHEQLPSGDYVSPNFLVIKLESCFPYMQIGNVENITNPLFRKEYDHNWYVDPNYPECGFLTRDEAHILFNAALSFRGKNALEIGSHVGWSTIHFAMAGVILDTIEPQLGNDPRILLSLIQSVRLSGLEKNINLINGFSPKKVEEIANVQKKKWSIIFIDGNHNGEYPLQDAIVCSNYADVDCMIFFHDLVFPDVFKGFSYFFNQPGWRTRIYQTQQIMGVAWRGVIDPPVHIPDPKYNWNLPEHMSSLYDKEGNPIQF